MDAWTVKRDGSVQRGGEMVSPPLDFDDPIQRQQVTDAVQCLQRAGCEPHPSAGIHVHIEAKHEDGTRMNAREIAAVMRFTYKFEDAIYRIASSGWDTIRPGYRTYAKPSDPATVQAMREVQSMEDLQNVWQGQRMSGRQRYGTAILAEQTRYNGTNLQSFFDRGTIEFRYCNSSINPIRVQTYIAFFMAIVQDARNGFTRKPTTNYPLGTMAEDETMERKIFLRLQQIFRTDSRDSKICMSEEDWKNLRRLCWRGSKPQADNYLRRVS